MTLTVDQILNWELPVQFKNEALARAKKQVEGFKKFGKKTPKDTKRNVVVEDNAGPLTFYV